MASKQGIRAGKAYVELFADSSPLAQGLRRAEMSVRKFGRSVSEMGRNMAMLGGAMLAPIVAVSKAAADFESQMANVATMLERPQQQLKSMGDGVRALAVEFGESTATLSKGLYDLLSAGVDSSKALDVLRVAAMAARAGVTDTGVAVDGITSILNAYQLSAADATRVSDLMFTTVKAGKITFAELASNVGKVAPMARAAGVGIEDMLAALATMTRQGINAEQASTKLNAIFRAMPSAAKDLLGTIKKFEGMDLEQIMAIVPEADAASGIAALSGDLAGLQKDLQGMDASAGATEKAFAQMAGTMATKFGELKEGILALATSVGQAIAPEINALMKSLKKVVEAVTGWAERNQELIATVGALALKIGVTALAVGGILLVFGKIVSVAAGVILAIKQIGLALTWLAANPMVLVGAGVAGLIVAFLALTKAMDKAHQAQYRQSSTAKKALEAGDKQRANTIALLDRLKELDAQTSRTAGEQEEMARIVGMLNKEYQGLGLTIDKTTGKVLGLSKAQQQMNERMLTAAKAQAQAAIFEAKANREKAQRAYDDFGTGRMSFEQKRQRGMAIMQGRGDEYDREQLDSYMAQRMAANADLQAAQARLDALLAGDSSALTGGTAAKLQTATPGAITSEKASKKVFDARMALFDVRERQRRERLDAEGREVQAIQDAAFEELAAVERLIAAEAEAGRLVDMKAAKAEILRKMESDVAAKQAEHAARRIADQAQAATDYQVDLQARELDARIALAKGSEKAALEAKRAALAAEQALESEYRRIDALEGLSGQQKELMRQKAAAYIDLQAQAATGNDLVERALAARGTFSTTAAKRGAFDVALQRPMEQVARNTDRMARGIDDLVRRPATEMTL